MDNAGHKVRWGDDCPVCGAKKSIIAGIDPTNNKLTILRCLKCKTVFDNRPK